MKGKKKITAKIILIAAILLLSLGSVCTVSAAGINLVGQGTRIASAASQGGTSSASKGNTSAATAKSADNTGKATATTTKTGNSEAYAATKTSPVNTGYFEDVFPYVLMMAAGFMVLALCVHKMFDSIRIGDAEGYREEMDVFRQKCRIDR